MIEAAAMLGGRQFEVYLRSLLALMNLTFKVNSAACRLPLVNRAEGVVLDRLLGPAEEFEYVSSTAPGPLPTSY